MESKPNNTVVATREQNTIAKSFLQAIAEIEQISASEIEIDLPPGAFPTPSKFSFSNVAFKHGLMTTTATFLIAPFSMLVSDKFLTLFGNQSSNIIDTFFAYLLSAAPTITITLFFIYIINNIYLRGAVTKSLLTYYITTYIGVKFVFTLVYFGFFWGIHGWLITTTNILFIAKKTYAIAKWFFSPTDAFIIAEWVYKWSTFFRETLIPAAKYSTAIHIGCAIFIGIAYLKAYWLSKKIDLLRKEWE